jgi:DNA-binding transcriptional ArsR family regulator
MVQYQPRLDDAFGALADPTRRTILERLGLGEATITDLAAPFGMSLTGMKKHVRVLERAGLVRSEKVGRERRCSLGERRLDDVERWIESYRELLDGRLERLGEMLASSPEGEHDERQTQRRKGAGQ